MPELPEVETIKNGLNATIVGRAIQKVEVLSAKSFVNWNAESKKALIGATIEGMDRRGKLLIFNLEGPFCFTCHLRMTGQMVFREANAKSALDGFAGGHPNASLIGELPDRSTRVVFSFTDGSHLYFNDQRKFGFITVLRKEELPNDRFVQKLGPEPLSDAFDWQVLRAALSKHSECIQAALLDQATGAGLGNIYTDESLFLARINPKTPANALSVYKLKKLAQAIKDSLTLAIEAGGSTARNYVNVLGVKGDYLDAYANVYGRGGLPCHGCGRPLKKIKVAGRGTVYCPHCQPESK
jgi:formamidopyrimidine-DNA glycosylase